MATNIGAKVTLDGEQAYKKALQDINAQCKALGSEMKLTTAQFANNAKSQESLRAKTEVLTRQIEAQAKKTELLKDNYEKLSKELGENDEKTQKAKKAYLDSATSLQKMKNEAGGASKETKDLGSSMDNTGDKAHKFKEALATIGKVAVAGIATVATAVTAVSTALAKGISQTAEYGDNVDKMSQKLGLSKQAYQEWDYVTQLAGANIDSLGVGFKTLTNKIADANNGSKSSVELFKKLGISTEELKNMNREDIFKLTISSLQKMGDTTERASLANKIFGRSGQELAPLLNMNADETSKLIQKFNDLGGVMRDDAVKASANYQDALTTMKLAFTGLRNNMMSEFLPAVTEVMDGITKLVSGQDGGLESINKGVQDLTSQLAQKIPQFVSVAGNIIGGLAKGLLDNLPTLIQTAIDLVDSLVNGLLTPENTTTLVDGAFKLVRGLCDSILENIDEIVTTALDMILALNQGLAENLPTLIPTVMDAILTIIQTIVDNLPMLIESGNDVIVAIIKGIADAIPLLIEKAPDIIVSLITALVEAIPDLLATGGEVILTLIVGILKVLPDLLLLPFTIIGKMVEKFAEGNGEMEGAGGNLVQGFLNGFKEAWEKLKGAVKIMCQSLVLKVKSFFGIHSPSKVFAEIGGFLAEGLGDGFTKGMKDTTQEMLDAMPTSLAMSAGGTMYGGRFGGLTITNNNTFNSATDRDANRLIRLTNRSLGLAYGGV